MRGADILGEKHSKYLAFRSSTVVVFSTYSYMILPDDLTVSQSGEAYKVCFTDAKAITTSTSQGDGPWKNIRTALRPACG
jgi:hypothetical protein